MNLIKLNLYGEGYYSGVEYNETIFLLEEDYKRLEHDFNCEEMCLGELDGKHSEVYGEVSVTLIKEENQVDYNFRLDEDNDGDSLYWHLYDNFSCPDINIEEMMQRAYDYINSLDIYVNISFKVRKSQVEKIKKVVSELIN